MSLEENWDLYKTFYMVAKCSSFSKAAEKLYVTQPSISYSIKQLETNLNTKLFLKSLYRMVKKSMTIHREMK